MTESSRPFLTERDNLDSVGADAEGDQKVFRRIGPAFAECQVVFAGTAFVGVSFEDDINAAMTFQPGGLLLKLAASVAGKIGLVKSEENPIADIDDKVTACSRRDAKSGGRSTCGATSGWFFHARAIAAAAAFFHGRRFACGYKEKGSYEIG